MEAQIGFAERFAYVRWLRARGRLSPESDRELAVALGVGESWIRKWKTRADAPEGRSEQKALERALAPLGVTVEWLYDNAGPPPQPSLWETWRVALSGQPSLPASDSIRLPGGMVIPLSEFKGMRESDLQRLDSELTQIEAERVAPEPRAKRAANDQTKGKRRR